MPARQGCALLILAAQVTLSIRFVRVSIHSRLHPPTDSFPAYRSRVNRLCRPMPHWSTFSSTMTNFCVAPAEMRGYSPTPRSTEKPSEVKISLKGELSNHKELSDESSPTA
jgi:hypothetical protein